MQYIIFLYHYVWWRFFAVQPDGIKENKEGGIVWKKVDFPDEY
jgi:hypothetical protein